MMRAVTPSTDKPLHDELLAISILRNADTYLCQNYYFSAADPVAFAEALNMLRSLRLLIVRESNARRKATQ